MIADFLIEALQEKDTVSVPGFGTFTAQPVSAVMDEETGILKPPSSEIVFIDDIGYGEADDSLVEYILYKSDKEREEVVDAINEFGSTVKDEVNQNDYYSIDGLGEFKKGLYGNITFKSDSDKFSGNSYGLPKLSLTPLSEDEIIDEDELDAQKEEVSGKKFPEATLWAILIPSIVIVLLAVWLMIDEGARNKATSMLTSAESGLFGGEASNSEENTENQDTETTEPAETNNTAENTNDASENSETGSNNDAKTADTETQEPAVEKQNPPVTSEPLVSSKTGHYYLSIASYPNKANALKRREQLVAQGYTGAKVVEAGVGKYRVSLADFASKADADKKVAEAKGDYDSIWVFKF